jgi:hypothetical protein
MNLMTTCSAGHDLTLPDAYLYLPSGRVCRECAKPKRRKMKDSTKIDGAFQ